MKENQRIALTKKMLQEGLLHLLETKELEKISVTELCREAGINRATFYRHYFVPRDIIFEMQVNFIRELHEMFGRKSVGKKPDEYLFELCTYLFDKADTVRVFIKHNTEEDFIALINLLVESFIKQDRESRAEDELDKESLKLISSGIAGGGYFMLREWLMGDINKTPAEIAEIVLRFVNREYSIMK